MTELLDIVEVRVVDEGARAHAATRRPGPSGSSTRQSARTTSREISRTPFRVTPGGTVLSLASTRTRSLAQSSLQYFLEWKDHGSPVATPASPEERAPKIGRGVP